MRDSGSLTKYKKSPVTMEVIRSEIVRGLGPGGDVWADVYAPASVLLEDATLLKIVLAIVREECEIERGLRSVVPVAEMYKYWAPFDAPPPWYRGLVVFARWVRHSAE